MRLGKILISCGVASVLALGTNLFSSKQAEAQSPRPFVVFVDGSGDCCAWMMTDLQNRLRSQYGAEVWTTTYSKFQDGSSTRKIGIPKVGSLSTDNDSAFLRDGANYINNQLDRNRPLILVGHSFGGDSILKLLPRINRRVQFVGVIDPVSTGGVRATLSRFTVPDNVDYFYNRWQDNVPFPFDFTVNGSIRCNARKCDQDKQPFVTQADGNVHRENCKWFETCKKKNRRASHEELAKDAWIQRVIGDRISGMIASGEAQPSTSVVSGSRLIQMGSGRCLTTPDLASNPNGANNGANSFLYDCYNANNTGYNQRWKLQQEGDSYRIVQTSSGRCLTTPDLASNPNGASNGANAFLYDCYNASGTGYNQRWRVQD